MAVKIIFKKKEEVAPEAPVEKPKKGAVSFGKKTVKADPNKVHTVDGFAVSPVFDLSVEPGKNKFLIHRHKKDIWYKLLAYDDYESGHNLKLESPYGAVFDSTLKITDSQFYMMAMTLDATATPTKAVLDYVRSVNQ